MGCDNMQIYSSITAQAESKLDWGNAPAALKWMLTTLCQSVILLSPFFCALKDKQKNPKRINENITFYALQILSGLHHTHERYFSLSCANINLVSIHQSFFISYFKRTFFFSQTLWTEGF